MNQQTLSEWLASLSPHERSRALTLIYSWLTVGTRQLFLPDMPKGKEEAIIRMLHGVNELHHTVANQLMAYSRDEEGYPLQGFDQQLTKIANQYGIQGLLTQAVDFARTRNIPPMK
jgi:hypothetical protein